MKKIVGISSLLFVFSFPLLAQETFTLTTYYPAPFGVYQRLVTNTLGVGDSNGNGIDASDAPDPIANPGTMWVSGNIGLGTRNPVFPLDVQSPTGSDAWIKVGTTDKNNSTSDAGIVFYEGPYESTKANQKWSLFNKAESETFPDWDRLIFAVGPGTDYRMAMVNNGNDFRVGIGAGLEVNTIPDATLEVAGGVKIANDAGVCSAAHPEKAGTMRYNSGQIQYCNGSGWAAVGAQPHNMQIYHFEEPRHTDLATYKGTLHQLGTHTICALNYTNYYSWDETRNACQIGGAINSSWTLLILNAGTRATLGPNNLSWCSAICFDM